MRLIVLVVSLLLVSGCASEQMKAYVGKDIKEVILDGGQPTMVMDIDKETRAYQWRSDQTNLYAGTSRTSGEVYGGYGYANINTQTVNTPAYASTNTCYYTFYAKKQGKDKWIITGFRKPSLACE